MSSLMNHCHLNCSYCPDTKTLQQDWNTKTSEIWPCHTLFQTKAKTLIQQAPKRPIEVHLNAFLLEYLEPLFSELARLQSPVVLILDHESPKLWSKAEGYHLNLMEIRFMLTPSFSPEFVLSHFSYSQLRLASFVFIPSAETPSEYRTRRQLQLKELKGCKSLKASQSYLVRRKETANDEASEPAPKKDSHLSEELFHWGYNAYYNRRHYLEKLWWPYYYHQFNVKKWAFIARQGLRRWI